MHTADIQPLLVLVKRITKNHTYHITNGFLKNIFRYLYLNFPFTIIRLLLYTFRDIILRKVLPNSPRGPCHRMARIPGLESVGKGGGRVIV